jgi:hypothetical protein
MPRKLQLGSEQSAFPFCCLTASWLTRAGGTPELIFHWSGAAFMVVGIGGFVVAIYRARAR